MAQGDFTDRLREHLDEPGRRSGEAPEPAHAPYLAALDARLTASGERLERLERELAAAEERIDQDDDRHLLLVPGPDGYALIVRSGPAPSPGTLVEVPEAGSFVVSKVAPAPMPDQRGRCAYLIAR